MSKYEDPELSEMIERFDKNTSENLNLDINDHLKIYNWMKELELYRKLYGLLK